MLLLTMVFYYSNNKETDTWTQDEGLQAGGTVKSVPCSAALEQ